MIQHQMKSLNSYSVQKVTENKIHICLHFQEPMVLEYVILKMQEQISFTINNYYKYYK